LNSARQAMKPSLHLGLADNTKEKISTYVVCVVSIAYINEARNEIRQLKDAYLHEWFNETHDSKIYPSCFRLQLLGYIYPVKNERDEWKVLRSLRIFETR
jgi:hypothetical protein